MVVHAKIILYKCMLMMYAWEQVWETHKLKGKPHKSGQDLNILAKVTDWRICEL